MPLFRFPALLWLIIITSGYGWSRRPNQSDFGQPIPTPTLSDTILVSINTTDFDQPITGIGVDSMAHTSTMEVTLTQTTSSLIPSSTATTTSKIPMAADAVFVVTFIASDE
ncbi:hypothetical protein [Chloroflexus sp.]|uniref:hypothetical protein n=1 Tax=Chloroflexus sp. TaxID=1904827 RepID=UPI002ADE1551|nr:hypothetical protein [Chloroflexus sp.]